MDRSIRTLRILAIVLAAFGFLLSYSISVRSSGMAEGLAVGDQELQRFKAEIGYRQPQVSSGIKGTYESFNEDYGYLAALFSILVLAALFLHIKNQFFEKEISAAILVQVLCVFSTIFIFLKLRELIVSKSSFLIDRSFFEVPRNFFANATITYDWILMVLVLLVAVLQVVGLVLHAINRKV
jgi:hypothetical protein